MKLFRSVLAGVLVLGLSSSSFAADLAKSAEAAAAAEAEQTPPPAKSNGGAKAVKLGGAALFVAGMAIGLNAFINNENGEYSEFGEADAVNKKLGATGIGMAFGGGLMMFLGNRAQHMPSVSIQKGAFSLGKRLTW